MSDRSYKTAPAATSHFNGCLAKINLFFPNSIKTREA